MYGETANKLVSVFFHLWQHPSLSFRHQSKQCTAYCSQPMRPNPAGRKISLRIRIIRERAAGLKHPYNLLLLTHYIGTKCQTHTCSSTPTTISVRAHQICGTRGAGPRQGCSLATRTVFRFLQPSLVPRDRMRLTCKPPMHATQQAMSTCVPQST